MNGNQRMGDSEKSAFLFMLPAHKGSCYQAQWHHASDRVFASAGGDGFLKLWDHSLPKQNIASVQAHEGEIMSLDFSKYDEIIATASTDKSVRLWDLRNLKLPVNILAGHRYPVRRVKFSPHSGTILATASYDMNVHIYDLKDPVNPLKMKHAQHT
jgi:peroxin-7